MIYKTTFLYISLLCCFFSTYACSCLPFDDKSFCDFVGGTEVVIEAKVIERNPDKGELTVRVIDTFKGRVPSKINIRSTMCSSLPNENLGDRIVFALNRHWDYPDVDAYIVPACGIYFLQIKNNRVKGAISRGKKSMSYEVFKKLIKTQNCPGSGPLFSFSWENQRLTIIDPSESYSGELSIEIYDLMGRNVGNIQLNMKNGSKQEKELPARLSKGIYVMHVEVAGDQAQVTKIFFR